MLQPIVVGACGAGARQTLSGFRISASSDGVLQLVEDCPVHGFAMDRRITRVNTLTCQHRARFLQLMLAKLI